MPRPSAPVPSSPEDYDMRKSFLIFFWFKTNFIVSLAPPTYMEATSGRNMDAEDENVVINMERTVPGFIFNPSYPVYNFETSAKETPK